MTKQISKQIWGEIRLDEFTLKCIENNIVLTEKNEILTGNVYRTSQHGSKNDKVWIFQWKM